MELKTNMQYSLDLEIGEFADHQCMDGDNLEVISISSESKPVMIVKETASNSDRENGISTDKEFHLIRQDGVWIIVAYIEEGDNEDCEYRKNGGSNYYQAAEIDMKNIDLS